jgi:hypothetical protein
LELIWQAWLLPPMFEILKGVVWHSTFFCRYQTDIVLQYLFLQSHFQRSKITCVPLFVWNEKINKKKSNLQFGRSITFWKIDTFIYVFICSGKYYSNLWSIYQNDSCLTKGYLSQKCLWWSKLYIWHNFRIYWYSKNYNIIQNFNKNHVSD